MKSAYRLALLFFSLAFFLISAVSNAETVERSTEYSSPYGSYKELTTLNSLTVGIARVFSPDNVAVAAQGIVTVNGNLQISNGPTLIQEKLFVDGDTLRVEPYPYYFGLHWVGIGAPSGGILAELDVRGNLWSRGLVGVAGSRGYFHVAPKFRENRLYLGTTDPATPPVSAEMGAKDDGPVWQPAYFKANRKIVLNSGDVGRSSGKVIMGASISTAQIACPIYADPLLKLIVIGEIRAQDYVTTSSRQFKTDIQSLTVFQYRQFLDDLSKTDIFHFHYKTDPSTQPLHPGVIAEKGPEEVLDASKKSVDLSNSIGFLLAVAKELALENEALEKEVAKLETELDHPHKRGEAHARPAK